MNMWPSGTVTGPNVSRSLMYEGSIWESIEFYGFRKRLQFVIHIDLLVPDFHCLSANRNAAFDEILRRIFRIFEYNHFTWMRIAEPCKI